MNSWDRSEITNKVKFAADELGASNPQQLKQLLASCNDAPSREVFFGLFSFFFDPKLQQNGYERQKLAGTLLLTIAPPSPIALDGSVYGSAGHWNLSISELPYYWCKVFGHTEVVIFLDDLIDSCVEAGLKRSVKTLLFWARGYDRESS